MRRVWHTPGGAVRSGTIGAGDLVLWVRGRDGLLESFTALCPIWQRWITALLSARRRWAMPRAGWWLTTPDRLAAALKGVPS